MSTPNRGERARDRPRLDRFRFVLFALITLYVTIFSALAFAQHQGLRTHRSDLGQIDQAIWNSSRGRWLEMTDNGYIATRLTDHVEPILVLISPLFWLWNDVRALLLLQALLVGLGAWPLFELARFNCVAILPAMDRSRIWLAEPVYTMSSWIALALACAYLLAPPLQSALLTEFHAAPLAVPLILWSFWAVANQHWRQFVIATLLVALVKEEMALVAAGLGVWALWRMLVVTRWIDRTPSPDGTQMSRAPAGAVVAAAIVTVASLLWFTIATFVIVPHHALPVYGVAESGYFQRYGALGDSPLDIVRSFVTQPGLVWQIATEPARVDYWRRLLQPFGYLSLLAPEILLLSAPLLLANLLSAYPAQYYGEFHYSAPVAVYFVVSAAYGVGRLWRWLGRRTMRMSGDFQHVPTSGLLAMHLMALVRNARTLRPWLAALLVVWILAWGGYAYAGEGHGPGGGRYDAAPRTEHQRLLRRFVDQIPRTAAVTATAAVHPHVSHRRYVYQFPLGLESPVPAAWALLDVTTATDMAPGDLRTLVEQMLAGEWGVEDAGDGFLLMRKGAPQREIPAAFYDFVRTSGSVPPSADGLHLVGLDTMDWVRWRQTQIQTEWIVGNQYDPAQMAPQITVRNANRDILYRFADAMPPALVWYPPAQWQPGERIRIITLPLYLPALWGVEIDPTPELASVAGLPTDAAGPPHLAAAYRRAPQGALIRLPTQPADLARFASTRFADHSQAALFRTSSGQELRMDGWLDTSRGWPGGELYAWLFWEGYELPAGYELFVHLRRQNELQDQVDGPPRYFVLYGDSALDATTPGKQAARLDLRALQIQVAASSQDAATWHVVVGLYEPQSGVRAEVFTTAGAPLGQEWLLGATTIRSRPPPDQACALIPATCASQTTPSLRWLVAWP